MFIYLSLTVDDLYLMHFYIFYLFNYWMMHSLLIVSFYIPFSVPTLCLFFLYFSLLSFFFPSLFIPLYILYIPLSPSFLAVPCLFFSLNCLSFTLPPPRSLYCFPSSLRSTMWLLFSLPSFSSLVVALNRRFFFLLCQFLFSIFSYFFSPMFFFSTFSLLFLLYPFKRVSPRH